MLKSKSVRILRYTMRPAKTCQLWHRQFECAYCIVKFSVIIQNVSEGSGQTAQTDMIR